MNMFIKMTGKLVVASQIFAITLALLTACGPGSAITICHATGDSVNPYEKITVNSVELNAHRQHPNDIIPAPAGGCPASLAVTTPAATSSDGKVTICHATGSKTNPYTMITVSVNGLNGHDKHKDDIIPAPQGGCPTTKP